ncbi:MAG: PfkB family carbohydrate kinase [Eubacteriales bacterium]|nr:PfkB family carbohydrate kinase [Eubacteriales bacterium]
MNIRSNCKYAVACVTSMGVRITPEDRMSVHESNRFFMQATSAETNVLNVSSSLGLPCIALTRFVKDSPIAWFIKGELRKRNINFEGPDVEQGGPWGYRHQFNIADAGFGLRAPRVWNDRAGEVGRDMDSSDYDLDRIFGEEGVQILHISGLIASMSSNTTKACLEIARKAKQYGTLISFDYNYRKSFWEGREEELTAAFDEIMGLSDILLGLGGPVPDIEEFKKIILEQKEKYPQAVVYSATIRKVVDANEHLWGAVVWADGNWYVEEPRPMQVLDRIGGGDGYSGGILYAIASGKKPEEWIKYGWAAGALAVSTFNDYASPIDEAELISVYEGNAVIKR